LAYQTFIMSFVSLLVWFWLLRHYLASRLGVLTFLTPVIGVVLGAVLLGEPLEAQFIAGAAVVLLGITTVSLHASVGGWIQRVFRPASS
jgi:drug/metabolite transporter (DMT)-like permease